MPKTFQPLNLLFRLLVVCLFVGAVPQSVLAAAWLVKDGKPVAAIVLPAEPLRLEQRAADELVEHIKLISDATLPVTTDGKAPSGMTTIHIGATADVALDDLTRTAGVNPSSFTLKVKAGAIHIRGLSDEGSLYGTYELLEQLGVRWYMPGDYGRVIPRTRNVSISDQTTSQAPSMTYRILQHMDLKVPWSRRARLGGESRSTGRHGIPGLHRNGFEKSPELYSLLGGVRKPRQDCLSNPETLRRATEAIRRICEGKTGKIYVGASSHDGGGYCQCEPCLALDKGVYDPTADRDSVTDRYIWFFNQILDNLEADYPQLHIVTYTYGAHMMPPAIKPNPRIVPVFAPITLDRTRGMDNPMSPDRHVFRWLIDQWSGAGINEMYFRGYYHNLACAQFPYSQIDRIRNETKAYHEKGITVMRVENIHTSWSSAFLDLYLAARMMWDVNTDVDALLEEFYNLYYGPAQSMMKQYHEELNSAFDDTPYITGSSYLYFPIFLNQPRTAALRGHLDRAAQQVRGHDPVYAKRIAAVRFNWDRFEIFLDMIDARNKHNFKVAHEKMQAFYAKSDEGVAEELEVGANRTYTNPRLIFHRERSANRGSYFNRFFSRPVVSGYERAVEKGEVVAPLNDEWLFLLDPAEIGEMSGYQRPGKLGGNWSPLRTSTLSWSDQGLHYYKGIAWYRQKVTIPKKFEGRDIYLWFGGVDELAAVWINGRYVGTNREPEEGLPGIPGTFRPFDMPATKSVKFGEDNWVVVRIQNKGLSELGTGGIVAPVMFWSPTGDWRPGSDK